MGGYLYLRVVPLFLKLHLKFCSMIIKFIFVVVMMKMV